ncbi:MAG: ABC transporter ATP-binding protein [Geminicoccaceae bacterium]
MRASPDLATAPPANGRPLLEATGLTVDFPGRLRAVDRLDLRVDRGEILAIVGESGSGKSVSALALMRLVPAPGRIVAGNVQLDGRDLLQLPEQELAAVRGRRIGLILQNPRAALNPSLQIGVQLTRTLRVLGREATPDKLHELLRRVGFPEPERIARSYPHELSGGMCQRACLALALAGGPDLLIADEPTTALDVAVQARVLRLLVATARQDRSAMILVTHDMALVKAVADRVVVLYGGVVQEEGPVDEVIGRPRHPYTRALVAAIPDPDRPVRRLAQIPGHATPVLAGSRGCRFAARCPQVEARCRDIEPPVVVGEAGSWARCHLLQPIRAAA